MEAEEQEMEDEMEGLVDQKMPLKQGPGGAFPGIPGLQGAPPSGVPPPPMMPGVVPPPLPGLNGGVPPPPLPGLAGLDPSNPADISKIAELMRKAGVQIPPPPPPGMMPPGMMPPGMVPPGFPAPPPPGGGGGFDDGGGGGGRRAPLPSQEESLRMEQGRGGHFGRGR